MEYLVVLLAIALIVVLFIRQPNKVQGIIAKNTIASLREKEAEIVQGLYNKLPVEIKEKIDSKMIASVVNFTIDVAIDALEDVVVKTDEK